MDLHFILGFLACVLYLCVIVATIGAARSADKSRDRLRWRLAAVFFAMALILRGTGLEAWLTQSMRESLFADGLYARRQDFQRPLAALAVVAISACLFFFYTKRPKVRGRSREWYRFWAMIGITLMAGLVGLRLISFHELDRALYGPIRLNWILDIGSSFLVIWAAVRFQCFVPASNAKDRGR